MGGYTQYTDSGYDSKNMRLSFVLTAARAPILGHFFTTSESFWDAEVL